MSVRLSIHAAGVLLLLTAAGLGSARTIPEPGCAQLGKIKGIFPAATTVGFDKRRPVRLESTRSPARPGCGHVSWWTSYIGQKASVDVSVTLYATPHEVGASFAGPGYGTVHVLANGARVRTSGPKVGASVNGEPASQTGAVSAYRNLFIGSISISVAKTPVSIAAQLRIHRAIETAFRLLH